jgi:metal-responsive CopG/Arc/MetJ family transcriptional regulator
MPKKGHKSTAGVGDIYESPKKRVNLMLTDEVLQALDQRAKELNISRSEVVERFGRGLIGLPDQEAKAKKRKRSHQSLATG